MAKRNSVRIPEVGQTIDNGLKNETLSPESAKIIDQANALQLLDNLAAVVSEMEALTKAGGKGSFRLIPLINQLRRFTRRDGAIEVTRKLIARG